MPFIPVTNTLRVTITYNDTTANEAVNVIHISLDETEPTPVNMNAVLDVVAAWLAAEWAPVASIQWSAVRLEALDLSQANSFYIDRVISVAGTKDSAPLPPQDTVAISLRSAFSGRSRRGRLYHVGLTEDDQNAGYLELASIQPLIDCYDDLRVDLALAGYQWVVVSYVQDGVPRAQGQRTPISSIILVDRIIDSMDKRKPRV